MPTSPDSAIRVQGLVRQFGSVRAVDHLSFDVPQGSITGLIGPNGAGKTTTLRILATLDLPDAGRAEIMGFDVFRAPWHVRRRVGFVSDVTGVVEHLSVREYLAFLGQCRGHRGAALDGAIDRAAAITGVGPLADRLVTALSKGQLRRLGVAGALLGDPAVLLLDEPAAGLDPSARMELREVLRQLVRERAMTVLISSHILRELEHLADRLVVMAHGRLAYSGLVHGLPAVAEVPIEVEPALGALPAVLTWLQAQTDVAEVAQHGLLVRFRTEAAPEDLLERAVRAGIRIRQFREVARDLEAVYRQAVSTSEAPS